jgi:hypothetical protein
MLRRWRVIRRLALDAVTLMHEQAGLHIAVKRASVPPGRS